MIFQQFELKEIKRRQDAAEEAERKRLQQEQQQERAAAEAQAEAARLAVAKDSHDAPGSPTREAGNKIMSMHFLGLFALNSTGKLTIKWFRELVLILSYIYVFSNA